MRALLETVREMTVEMKETQLATSNQDRVPPLPPLPFTEMPIREFAVLEE